MTLEFHTFGNRETYHFFRWLTDSGSLSTEELFEQAWKDAEGNDDLKMGCDACHVVRDELAGTLWGMLAVEADHFICDCLESYEIGVVDESLSSLYSPLLRLAVDSIDCGAVAEALLRRGGKWNPSPRPPEPV